jgi:hypothetical protein
MRNQEKNTNMVVFSQIRQGFSNETKGTAFVVYEESMDAKQACDSLNGFNFQNRYLVGTEATFLVSFIIANISTSSISSARKDGQVES